MSVSVTAPVSQAVVRAKRALFQPFDLSKWFIIGFCAWLAHFGERGFHAGFNYHVSDHRREQFERMRDYVVNNLTWIVPLAVLIVVIGLGLWVLFTWLSSRGRFMFLHCVALDKAEVEVPWRKFAREGNSLFIFRLVLGLIALVLTLPLMALMGVNVFRIVDQGTLSVGNVFALIVSGLAIAGFGIVFAVIGKFTTDFVVPIMFLRGRTCREGWRELLGLLSTNVGHFALYVLFQIVLAIAVAVMVFIIVIVTCCIAGCLLALPYLGTVLMLPILMFDRCYSLCYLAQFGPDYDAFPPPGPPAPGATPPGPRSPVAPA